MSPDRWVFTDGTADRLPLADLGPDVCELARLCLPTTSRKIACFDITDMSPSKDASDNRGPKGLPENAGS